MSRAAVAFVLSAPVFAACGGDDPGGPSAASSIEAPSTTRTGPGALGTAGAAVEEGRRAERSSSFGNAGVATLSLSADEHDRLMATTIAADGGVYAAGFVDHGGDQAFALVRIDPATGALDPSFGTDGVAVVNVAVGGKTTETARAVRAQADGKIVIAGPVEADPAGLGDAARDTDVALVRFDRTGRVDTAYGTDGIARLDFGPGKATSATAVSGDSSWGIAGGPGERTYVFGSQVAEEADRVDTDFVVAAVTAGGTLDPTFGTGGVFTADPLAGAVDTPRGIIVEPDGRIVTAGYSRTGDGVVSPVLMRLTSDGALDQEFGTGGVATARLLAGVAEAYNIARHGDGYVLSGYGRDADPGEKVDHIVYRFTGTGAWDQTFGTNGVHRLDLAGEDDRSRNLAVLPDGRILSVGSGKNTATDVDALIVLLDAGGEPVTGFGSGGHDLFDLGGPGDALFGVALSLDGDYAMIVGYQGMGPNGNDDAVAVRIDL